MASYFDPQPAAKNTAAVAKLQEISNKAELGSMSLLSPQVSRILNDLELEDRSSSDEASLSGDSHSSDKDAKTDRKARRDLPSKHSSSSTRKSTPSPLPQNKKAQIAQPPSCPGTGGQKNPHLARFHSLRSMLFSSQIEANMTKEKEKQQQDNAEQRWKQEHDLRRGLNRPKTPEHEKEGMVRKLGNKLRRMTSKEVPTLEKVKENDDNESTASSEDDAAGSDEDINHSDIEDIVRWVSRRDPPSDGEVRMQKGKREKGQRGTHEKEDSGHESLGHSDVDDLVRWVSRKDITRSPQLPVQEKDPTRLAPPEVVHSGYSDASTESDSELSRGRSSRKESIDDRDIDDLVRWVSHKEVLNAGPVRSDPNAQSPSKLSHPESNSDVNNSNTVESAPVTCKDGTSGESDDPSDPSDGNLAAIIEYPPKQKEDKKDGTKLKEEVARPTSKDGEMPEVQSKARSNASLTHDDVDELVGWVSKKNAG